MSTATKLVHPAESSWPGDTYLLKLSKPYNGSAYVVVCLQDHRYGEGEECAKVFPANKDGTYTGGPEFVAERFDYGTLAAVASQLGYTLK